METAVEIPQKGAMDDKALIADTNGKIPQNEVASGPNNDAKTQNQTTEKKPIKKSKDSKKNKEEEKRIKLLLKAFDGLENTEAKLEALAKKYVHLASEHKTVEYRKDDLETRNEKLTKERDALQSDYNKATLAKSKLESLCRELQRHSKLVKEECQLRSQEEETKRKELSDRFQTTINDISQQMQDNFKRNEQLKIENEDLATKLKGLVDQYESREEHVDKVFKHKQLELQLAEAKMAQQAMQFNEMKEKSLVEKQELLKDSLDYRKKFELMAKQEKELKAQVFMYTEKFEEFQSTLHKSNEMFQTFKKEMDKMTKTIKKLEKENKTWKNRWENTNHSMIAMLEERTKMEKEGAALRVRNEKLENLCRAMQKERLLLNKQVIDELPKPEEFTEQPPIFPTAESTHGTATPPMESTVDNREGEASQNTPMPTEMTSESSNEDTDANPDVHVVVPDVNMAVPDVDTSVPDAILAVPDVIMKVPDVDTSVPGAILAVQDVNMKVPDAEPEVQDVEGDPDVGKEVPDSNTEVIGDAVETETKSEDGENESEEPLNSPMQAAPLPASSEEEEPSVPEAQEQTPGTNNTASIEADASQTCNTNEEQSTS